MAAITKRLLHLRPVPRPHPYSFQHFSASADAGPSTGISQTEPEPGSNSQTQTATEKTSFSSNFSDVKASLQREPPPQNRLRRPPSFSNPNPRPAVDLEEIRRNLSEFRRRSAPPPPPSSGQFVSFQELYKRNVTPKDDASPATSDSPGARPDPFQAMKESVQRLKASTSSMGKIQAGGGGKLFDPTSLRHLKDSLNMKSQANAGQDFSMIIGGSQSFSPSTPEMLKRGSDSDNSAARRMMLARSYNYSELGEKLNMLRPEKKKGKWFTLQELTERLVKLREMDDKENKGGVASIVFRDLRESLEKLHNSEAEDKRKKTMRSLEVLGQLGSMPSYMLSPPKEELVEKYFHPDHMSSAEKLKLELKKVRDEFKMSESDCGSARVQVAQLTTKIKHLSSLIHKKDKHSRKGLEAMVQRRKKLLKYLRRTDWDSYTLVLSKLGLRDNQNIKA